MRKSDKVKRRKFSTQTKTFYFDKFNGWARGEEWDKNTMYSVECRNCDCMDGTLKRGVTTRGNRNTSGIVKYPVAIADIDRFFYTYKREIDGAYTPTLSLLTKLGKYYYLSKNTINFKQITTFTKGDRCEIAPYFDPSQQLYMLLFGENGVTAVQEGSHKNSENVERFECGCVLDDRAYGIIRHNALVYSAPLDALNFDSNLHDAGRMFIQCDKGVSVALKPLGKRLYLFYEYGIVEIEPAGSGTNFKIRKMSYTGGKIMRGCVGECMGKLYFFALDGVYAVDHNGVEKKFEKLRLKGMDTTKKGSFAAFNGGFFLRYYDLTATWSTVFLDVALDNGYKTMDMPAVSELDGQVLFAGEGMMQFVVMDGAFPTGERALFKSEALKFGTDETKLLKRICFTGQGSVVVRIFNGKEWQSCAASFTDGVACIEPKISGQVFQLDLSPAQTGIVSSCSMDVEFIGRA